jgi:hypothetical protein
MTDGGPAFPSDFIMGNSGTIAAHKPYSGMSLRDWFAGQAIMGMKAGDYDLYPSEYAEAAYELADAMLKARGK